MRHLFLTNGYGKKALVDDEDYERFRQFTWSYDGGYAYRWLEVGGRSYLHNEVMGVPAHSGVDHINRNKLDNRKENLRIIRWSQNIQNSVRSDNKYGLKGVSFHKRVRKFFAQINIGKKRILHLGYFETPEEAAVAYDRAAIVFHGPDALTNEKLRREQELQHKY